MNRVSTAWIADNAQGAASPAKGAVDLFNGKDLTGWPALPERNERNPDSRLKTTDVLKVERPGVLTVDRRG